MRIHDGAYGTLLQHHLHGDETVDDLCLRSPVHVVDAHRAYIEAGATAIQTNAFLAHLRTSRRRRDELQRAALACAREAAAIAAPSTLVIATIGPAGVEPRDFWRDIELVLDAEAAAVLCETITDRRTADAYLDAWADVAAGVTGTQVLLGGSVSPSGGPDAVRWILDLASEAPEEVQVGLNCCEGPLDLRPTLEALCEVRGGAWVMPSAGLPRRAADGDLQWPFEDPARWAEVVTELVADLPVSGIGGCCGTSPASIGSLQLP